MQDKGSFLALDADGPLPAPSTPALTSAPGITEVGETSGHLDHGEHPLQFLEPQFRRYRTVYDRLLANTKLSEPGNYQSCWLWQGATSAGYPRFTYRVPGAGVKGSPRAKSATRAMLEELLEVQFPFDEAGHLCDNPLCLNPDHLEVQTRAHNMAQRWGRMGKHEAHANWIPTLYPITDELKLAADAAWDEKDVGADALDAIPF